MVKDKRGIRDEQKGRQSNSEESELEVERGGIC